MKKIIIVAVIVLAGAAILVFRGNDSSDTNTKQPIPSQVTNQTIEEYVSAHISELSPEKEVLGGKFYITSIETHTGTGTVHYEDGHIALVADFTYIVDESGTPKVISFKVRK